MNMTENTNEVVDEEVKEELKIAYLCDGEGCAAGRGHGCPHMECTHTFDIHHAKNFKMIETGTFFEQRESDERKQEN